MFLCCSSFPSCPQFSDVSEGSDEMGRSRLSRWLSKQNGRGGFCSSGGLAWKPSQPPFCNLVEDLVYTRTLADCGSHRGASFFCLGPVGPSKLTYLASAVAPPPLDYARLREQHGSSQAVAEDSSDYWTFPSALVDNANSRAREEELQLERERRERLSRGRGRGRGSFGREQQAFVSTLLSLILL